MTILSTARLRLEPVSAGHLAGLLALHSDPEVTRYLGAHPERPYDTLAMIARAESRWRDWQFGWWSIFERHSGELIGAGGVQYLNKTPGEPLELGWRLRRDHWGMGYATEAANAMAAFAFDRLTAPMVCAVCRPDNRASQGVMQRLGMQHIDERMVDGVQVAFYELSRCAWLAGGSLKERSPSIGT